MARVSVYNSQQKQSLKKCFEKGWTTTKTLKHVNNLKCSKDNQLGLKQVAAAVKYYPNW